MRAPCAAVRCTRAVLAAPSSGAGPPAATKALPAPVQGLDVTEIGTRYQTFGYTGTRNVDPITSAGVSVTDPIGPAAAPSAASGWTCDSASGR